MVWTSFPRFPKLLPFSKSLCRSLASQDAIFVNVGRHVLKNLLVEQVVETTRVVGLRDRYVSIPVFLVLDRRIGQREFVVLLAIVISFQPNEWLTLELSRREVTPFEVRTFELTRLEKKLVSL